MSTNTITKPLANHTMAPISAEQNELSALERLAVEGDLSQLTAPERVQYYGAVCRSLGLNPLTKPFAFITLNERLTLYALRDATDQLRKLHGITVEIVSRESVEGVYVVTARATTPDGRSDSSIGAVPLVKEGGHWQTAQSGKRYLERDGTFAPLSPEDRANAIMKAETKSKRRVTLSLVGLGWLDETEIETIRGARRVAVADDGEIMSAALPPPASPAAAPPAAAVRIVDEATGEIQPTEAEQRWFGALDDYQAAYDEAAGLGVDLKRWVREPDRRTTVDLLEAATAKLRGAIAAARKRPQEATPSK